MPRKPVSGDLVLRFAGKRVPLKFSDVRELYLQAHGWKGIPTEMQRKRLEGMHQKFQLLNGLFGRVDAGESIKQVAASAGVSAQSLKSWYFGRALPKIVSPLFIKSGTQRRLSYLRQAALSNPRMGYILGARVSGHLAVCVGKRGQVSIASSLKKGTIENELRKAQKDVFGYKLKPKTRVLKRKGSAGLASEMRVASVEVAGFLNKTTFFGERIPFEFLKNKEAKRQFAMALIDSSAYPFRRSRAGGKLKEAGIIFRTAKMAERDYLSKLLSEFKIKNSPRDEPILSKKEAWEQFKQGALFQKGKEYGLFIPKAALEQFRKQIGFRDKAKAQLLGRIISQA